MNSQSIQNCELSKVRDVFTHPPFQDPIGNPLNSTTEVASSTVFTPYCGVWCARRQKHAHHFDLYWLIGPGRNLSAHRVTITDA